MAGFFFMGGIKEKTGGARLGVQALGGSDSPTWGGRASIISICGQIEIIGEPCGTESSA